MRIDAVKIGNFKSFADTGKVHLGNINVLVGRNNSGKSAFIRAVGLLQNGITVPASDDVRLGTTAGHVQLSFSGTGLVQDVKKHFGATINEVGHADQANLDIRFRGPKFSMSTRPTLRYLSAEIGVDLIPGSEPKNFVYAYLSKRKVAAFEEEVNRARTTTVTHDLRFLVPKIDRLANPDHPRSSEYAELCNRVLGFRVSAHASPNGKQAGIPVGNYDYIPIESMGEGVSSLLGLIVDLCMADGNLFLIEELENDIHPEGLKALLEVIVEKSETNQFIISTHSNIIVKYLGAAPGSKIFDVDLSYTPGEVPTSSIREIEPTPEARIAVLRKLGYELYDFDLWEGWLILEEASAEIIVRDYLIPWFAPRLSRMRTLSAGGTGKVEATFDDFHRLFLFAHLQRSQYDHRAWVVVDGDETGLNVIAKLKQKYRDWPAEHFRTLSESDFERYYPERFAEQVTNVLAKSHKEKRIAKKPLLEEVKKWCDDAPEEAKVAFESSASEVIELLREIEAALFPVVGK